MDHDDNLFLAVSAYGAVEIQKLMTDCNRTILLQYLPPLYYDQGFDPKLLHLLPVALQPFFIEAQRKCLPYKKINNIDFLRGFKTGEQVN